MSLNNTPSSERIHIGFFGKRNAGKSSVVNAVTNQQMSVVSDILGTTTDPVTKAMELLPLGPVLIIDTPGFDDNSDLGEQRIQRTKEILRRTDIAVLVVDSTIGKTDTDYELIKIFKERNVPYIIAYNKCDLTGEQLYSDGISVSARKMTNIYKLKEAISRLVKIDAPSTICSDLINKGSLVVLVIPIDSSAPKGRIILPQQQVLRDVLEAGAAAICVRDTELESTLKKLSQKPALVITDSQAFESVSKIVPDSIMLTSFSILMARYKGFLKTAVKGAKMLDELEDGDKILIAEGCTHHRQCEDIGTVKLPKWIRKHSGKELEFETSSGNSFPQDITPYKLIIHCGGCMLNEKEMQSRREIADAAGVPFTNYGTAIAHMNGILKRSLAVLPNYQKYINKGRLYDRA